VITFYHERVTPLMIAIMRAAELRAVDQLRQQTGSATLRF
jgi:hypothetical protein